MKRDILVLSSNFLEGYTQFGVLAKELLNQNPPFFVIYGIVGDAMVFNRAKTASRRYECQSEIISYPCNGREFLAQIAPYSDSLAFRELTLSRHPNRIILSDSTQTLLRIEDFNIKIPVVRYKDLRHFLNNLAENK